MIGFTYVQLKQALLDWPEESKPEYTSNIDRIIELGELRLIRDLNLGLFDKTDLTPAVTAANPDVTKPTDLVSDRTLFFVVGGVKTRLLKRSLDFVKNYAPASTFTGTPKYYADKSDTTWTLAPYPIANGTLDVHYVARPASIVTAGTSWFGDKCGDLLFACCLLESEQFIKADDRYQDLASKYYKELLPKASSELRNQIRTGDRTPLQATQG
jgi:hypothetical protein